MQDISMQINTCPLSTFDIFSDRPYNLDNWRMLESIDIIFRNYVAALLTTNLQSMELMNESIMQLKLDNHKMHD